MRLLKTRVQCKTVRVTGMSSLLTFNPLLFLQFALAVVCHGFGPFILLDSEPSPSFGKGFIGFNPLVPFIIRWLTPTVACCRLGPLIPSHSASSVAFGTVV